MQIQIPGTLNAILTNPEIGPAPDYDFLPGTRRVLVQFGGITVISLFPVREPVVSYDTRADEEDEEAVTNETVAALLTKVFTAVQDR